MTQSSTRKVSESSISPALLQAAAHMSPHDSSESPADAHEQDQDQDQDHDQEDDNEAPTKRPKRSRACQACRAMKIRCLPVEGQEACKACAKVNRACIMPGPARKRQKTVHKVAELEKKIDALTASLAAKNNTVTAPTPPTDSPATTSTPSTKFQPPASRPEREYSWDAVMETHYPSVDSGSKQRVPELERESVNDEYEDILTRGIIDEVMAVKIYRHWRLNMCPYWPIVAFPEKIGVDWLRKKRPMTLLAIFVVASGTLQPDLQPDLAVEMARQLADRVMFYNEKSLDLIQAILIYSTWYGKHKYAKDLGFNNYLHLAVSMSLDMGYGKRSRQQIHSDPEDAEIRRTWMGCYFLAGNVSTVLRLPPLVKFSPYLEECLKSFETHPGALPSDHFLCCLAKITCLMQDVSTMFQMDDPGANIPVNDTRTQYQLKLFERQLSEWVETTRGCLPKPFMEQYEACTSLFIHEIALHNEHNIDDFRPLYRGTGRETPIVSKDFFTNAHLEALTICVDSIVRAINAFLDMEPEMIRCAPAIHVVWTAYVVVAMIRLHGILALPDSKYGSIFLSKLDVVGYIDGIIQKLTQVIVDAAHVQAESFIIAFKKLKIWHLHRTAQAKQALTASNGKTNSNELPEGSADAYIKAYNQMPDCGGGPTQPDNDSSRRSSLLVQPQPQRADQFQQSPLVQPHNQQLYSPIGAQPFSQQPTTVATSSSLLDSNAPIDASTFDIGNWDFSVGEMNNFENYLTDSGWMGYLM